MEDICQAKLQFAFCNPLTFERSGAGQLRLTNANYFRKGLANAFTGEPNSTSVRQIRP